jgi:leader peptidase (prepilin peptidase)/N-methyltransferase
MLGLLIFFCTLVGLAIGSFLNVVIYRVPHGLSIVTPRSACPNCKTPIEDRDNVPVVSWLVLRGRCRACGAPISRRYPLVEATTGLLFAGLAWCFGWDWALPAYLAMVAGLFALAMIDFDCRLLPKKVVYPLLALVGGLLAFASAMTGDWRALGIGAICAVAWFALFFAINLASPKAMGFGDVRLSLVLGLGLGWLGVSEVVVGFFAANLLGAVVGVVLIATKRATRKTAVPYGVFLALGAAVAIFTSPFLQLHLRGGG